MPVQVGVAGVVAALSVASDLTRGRPPGEAMRATLVATELARRCDRSDLAADVYYATLLRFSGCSATSHEAAANFGGDDIAVRARGDLTDATRPSEAMRLLASLGSGPEKLRILARAPRVPGLVAEAARADCEVGAGLVDVLELPTTVRDAVLCAFERFDGKGAPTGRAGDDLPAPSRFAAVAYTAVMSEPLVRRWSGRALDPTLAEAFLDHADELLDLAGCEDPWAAVVAAEPRPPRFFRDDAQLDEVLAGFGDAADLKAPFFHGHARGVAVIARAAAAHVDGVDATLVYRAGLLHDLGRVAIPTGVWERPGPLSPDEWELVRLHPYHSGRILARSDVLAPMAPMVARHHERLDGSGYPMGVRAAELDAATRLLAAAEAWQTLTATRPHRPAHTPADAARLLSESPLDRAAVRAVLKAGDGPAPTFAGTAVELTPRELEVLRLLTGGLTKKQIAADLFISTATVHTHTVHIYAKCEVSTRAGLAMFAMRHGLLTSHID